MQIHIQAQLGNLKALQRQLARGINIDAADDENCTALVYATNGKADIEVVNFLLERGANPMPSVKKKSLKSHPLFAAAKRGDLLIAEALIRAGADARSVDDSGYNALHILCYGRGRGGKNPSALVSLLVENGTQVNQLSSYNESPLSVAVRFCNLPLIHSLLEHGADRSLVNISPLAWAVLIGSKLEMLAELRADAKLEGTDRWNRTPFLLSVRVDDFDKAICLEEVGANVHVRGEFERSSLYFAAENGNLEMCRWLLSLGLRLDVIDVFEESPMVAATRAGKFELVKLFLEVGALPESEDLRSSAIVEAQSPEIVRLLIDAGWDIDTISGCGDSVLKKAVEENQVELVRELLAMGADPDNTQTRTTALHHAMSYNHLEAAELLIKAGADVNAGDVDWDVPLYFARTLEGIELLLRYGANVDSKSGCRINVIACHRDPEIIDRLIEASPNPNVTADGLGELLLNAGEHGDLEFLEFLLTRNVDVNWQNSWGKTALMEAVENDRVEFANRLCELGANVKLVDEDQRTALFYSVAPEAFSACQLALQNYPEFMESVKDVATNNGGLLPADLRELMPESPYGFYPTDSTRTLELLLSHGADIEAKDRHGRTPLHLACQFGRPSKVGWLLSHGANPACRCSDGLSPYDVTYKHFDTDQAEAIRQLLGCR